MTSRAHRVPANDAAITTDTAEQADAVIATLSSLPRVDRTRLPLSHSLWSHLHIDERVIVETNIGEVISGRIVVGPRDVPLVELAADLDVTASSAIVRKPRDPRSGS